jgi:hypothetical protein
MWVTPDVVTHIGTWANSDPAVVLTAVATIVRYDGGVTRNGCANFANAVENQFEQRAPRHTANPDTPPAPFRLPGTTRIAPPPGSDILADPLPPAGSVFRPESVQVDFTRYPE